MILAAFLFCERVNISPQLASIQDYIGYIFEEIDALLAACACERIEISNNFNYLSLLYIIVLYTSRYMQ